ncbi:MAG: amidohydrolase family protein [Planctomycetia bacterium]|nr:amidohydrolase family protein [Planctomycetia bacterium]
MKYTAKRYDTTDLVEVRVENGKIAGWKTLNPIPFIDSNPSADPVPWIAPGFFDIQINGGIGIEFSSPDLSEEQVRSLCEKLLTEGVFRFCPTITTNDPEIMIRAIQTIVSARIKYPQYADQIAGIHLEGPFISRTDGPRGAHPLKYCREYDLDLYRKFADAGKGLLRILTLSPEYDGAEDFIRAVCFDGVLVSIGHTNASPHQIAKAISAGARLSTHLSNATSPLLAKSGNYCFAQMADDRLAAGIIADGFHVVPTLLKIIVWAKRPENIILVSDQSSLAGFPPGKYTTQLCDLEILPNGRIGLAGDPNLLAAAWFPVSRGVANLRGITDLSLKVLMDMAGKNPARLLNLPDYSNGSSDFLQIGAPADFILFQIEPARLSQIGIADPDNFKPGRMILEKCVFHGNSF